MISFFIILACIASFGSTMLLIPKWIRKAESFGLTGKDMNKPGKPNVAEMGGICIIWGFGVGLLLYIGLDTFLASDSNQATIQFLAAYCTILMIAILGMMDDILGWKKGITNWKKPLLVLPASIPMVVINTGQSVMVLPLIGTVDWGIIYPLIIIPVAITCASNGFNIIAGFNGLEAGMGLIIIGTMTIIATLQQSYISLVLLLSMGGTLAAFYIYNKYPARIFPGDTMTYAVGALIACAAIYGDMEKIALVLFIPYIIDIILVARSRFKAEAFAIIDNQGRLSSTNKTIFKLTDLILYCSEKLGIYQNEKRLVMSMLAIEFCIAILALLSTIYVR